MTYYVITSVHLGRGYNGRRFAYHGYLMMLMFLFWGLFGGFSIEGLEFSRAIRHVEDWPWKSSEEPGAGSLAASVAIRLVVSGGLAVAAGKTHQITGPFGAVATGVSAPLVIEQLARTPLTTTSRKTSSSKTSGSISGEEADKI
jgi:hypothetical protein